MPECAVLSISKSYQEFAPSLLASSLSVSFTRRTFQDHILERAGETIARRKRGSNLNKTSAAGKTGEIIDLIREVDRLHVVRMPAVARQPLTQKLEENCDVKTLLKNKISLQVLAIRIFAAKEAMIR